MSRHTSRLIGGFSSRTSAMVRCSLSTIPRSFFAPASTTKLYSVAAAMDELGADYRFETPIYRRGEVDAEGHLQGDLILVASGDLTLGAAPTRKAGSSSPAATTPMREWRDIGETLRCQSVGRVAGTGPQVAAAGINRFAEVF